RGRNTVRLIGRRTEKTFDHAPRHIQLRIDLFQSKKLLNDLSTSRSRQDLVAGLADLRRKQAHPNLPNLVPARPEIYKVTEISGTGRHLPRNCAVNGN